MSSGLALEVKGAHGGRWKRYPGYRDSGIDWLGEVPEGWIVNKLRFHINVNPTKSEVQGLTPDTAISFVPMEAVGEYGGLCLDQTKPIENVIAGYTYFREDDVVVAKITPCFENGKGAVIKGLKNGIGFGTTELHVLRPSNNIDCYFLFYLTVSYTFRKLGESEMYGAAGQKRVPENFIKNLKHPIPPLPEQRAIAAFLDRETGRIDTLIEKKERQIKLLQEKRAALISHAVTKGLDPDVKMKDSGVEWLGEVPEGWEIKKLGYQAKMIVPMRDKPPSFNGDIPWIRIEDFNGKYISDSKSNQRVSKEITNAMNLKVYPIGTVLCSCSCNMGATAIVENPLISNQTFIGIVPKENIDSEYLYYLMNSNSERLQYLGSGAIQQYLSKENFQNLKFAIPSHSEQRTIAAFLDRETGRIDTLTIKVQESISKLREYRTALISAAITGKIDVRQEVA
jgi:type I restriction enzyme S subunit